jgi:hypothetical protein
MKEQREYFFKPIKLSQSSEKCVLGKKRCYCVLSLGGNANLTKSSPILKFFWVCVSASVLAEETHFFQRLVRLLIPVV